MSDLRQQQLEIVFKNIVFFQNRFVKNWLYMFIKIILITKKKKSTQFEMNNENIIQNANNLF